MKPKPTNGPLPPHDPDVEAAALGSLLWSPVDGMNACEERGVIPQWFYELRHQVIFGTLQGMANGAQGIDVVTLVSVLGEGQVLEKCGGMTYVAGLQDRTAGAAMLEHYLDILQEKYQLRQVLHVCGEASTRVWAGKDESSEIIPTLERDVLGLSEERVGQVEQLLKPVLAGVVDELEKYHRGHAQMVGVTTGIAYLDKMLLGLGGDNGNMIVISGRPGTGKTSFALDVVNHAALDYEWAVAELDAAGQVVMDGDSPKWIKRRGIPVGIFSLEMSTTALAKRMLFQRARADLQRWRTGFGKNEDMPALVSATAKLSQAAIWIDDTARCTISEVKAKARRWARSFGIQLFVLDYIQLMRVDGRRFREDRVQELGEISGELCALAKELKVPWLILAQMNRDYEKDPNRKPRLSDLKDCGAIEQDADVVAFLFAKRLDAEGEKKLETQLEPVYPKDWVQPQRVDLLVAKNRYGPCGNCELLFEKHCTHFLDYNLWLKQHGLKHAAAGERHITDTDLDNDLPTTEQMLLSNTKQNKIPQ